jgi:hypothetical protein
VSYSPAIEITSMTRSGMDQRSRWRGRNDLIERDDPGLGAAVQREVSYSALDYQSPVWFLGVTSEPGGLISREYYICV